LPIDCVSHITIIEVDFLDEDTLTALPDEIDAYYLIHSMSGSDANYDEPIRASFCNQQTTKKKR
jgi:hypothetical protein